MNHDNDKRVVAGFRLPIEHIITDAELAWITALREVTNDLVRPPSLGQMQVLRMIVGDEGFLAPR